MEKSDIELIKIFQTIQERFCSDVSASNIKCRDCTFYRNNPSEFCILYHILESFFGGYNEYRKTYQEIISPYGYL